MAERKAHVKRVYQVDPDTDEVNKDVWIDVLRIDSVPISERGYQTGTTVITNYKFNWNDDPNNNTGGGDQQQENANPKRETHKLKIKNPDDDTQVIELWIVDKATTYLRAQDSGQTNQGTRFAFNNMPFFIAESDPVSETPPSNRTTSVVKVVNNDLKNLNMDSPVDWADYLNALHLGSKDDSQHVIVEMTDDFKILFGPDARLTDATAGIKGQLIKYKLNTRPVEDLFEKAAPLADPKTPALRTDPLQNIVNVQWGKLIDALAIYGSVNIPDYSIKFLLKAARDETNTFKREFSASTLLPTHSHDAPDTVSAVNDYLQITSIIVSFIDYKGNATIREYDTASPGVPYAIQYFNIKGVQVPSIPQIAASRGRALVKDDSGTVYVTGSYIIKVAENGDQLWKLPIVGTTAVNMNKNDNTKFIVTNPADDGTIKKYNVSDGTVSATVKDFNIDEFSGIADVTRDGKAIAFAGGSNNPFAIPFIFAGLKIFDLNGNLLGMVPPSEIVKIQQVAAYGNNFIFGIVSEATSDLTTTGVDENGGFVTTQNNYTKFWLTAWDAQTAAEVMKELYCTDQTRIVTSAIGIPGIGGSPQPTVTTKPSYGSASLRRNEFYPPGI